MRAVVQRVKDACVTVDDKIIGKIERGILIYLAVLQEDDGEQANALAEKIAQFRIFPDENHKMNRSVLDIQGQALVISQFTLAADCKKGKRPSFDAALAPEKALPLYERFVQRLQALGVSTQTGSFGAYMQIHSINDGPVTFILEK